MPPVLPVLTGGGAADVPLRVPCSSGPKGQTELRPWVLKPFSFSSFGGCIHHDSSSCWPSLPSSPNVTVNDYLGLDLEGVCAVRVSELLMLVRFLP